MSLEMPPLETTRLLIRPFEMADLEPLHQILDVALADVDVGSEGALSLAQRAAWLEWSVRNYAQLAHLYQPPFGDRAVVLRATQQLIGACGLVPTMGPFAQLPSYAPHGTPQPRAFNTIEFGLYYALDPQHQRTGYATEAAQALIDYAFAELNLHRIVATTAFTNAASMGVMRKLGMQIERNPFPDPPWFQVVGTRTNPHAHTT